MGWESLSIIKAFFFFLKCVISLYFDFIIKIELKIIIIKRCFFNDDKKFLIHGFGSFIMCGMGVRNFTTFVANSHLY